METGVEQGINVLVTNMRQGIIRKEEVEDYKAVERLHREAFWNLYVPGCDEHYLAHILRIHPDFVPELDFVLELDGEIIGNILYTKSYLSAADGTEKDILTFGPVAILPSYQHQGYGRQLLTHSFDAARKIDYEAIVIMGDPANYVKHGFKSGMDYGIALEDGTCPYALLVKELKEGSLTCRKWIFRESEAYNVDKKAAEEFDKEFEPKEKKHCPSQDLFYIQSHAVMRPEE